MEAWELTYEQAKGEGNLFDWESEEFLADVTYESTLYYDHQGKLVEQSGKLWMPDIVDWSEFEIDMYYLEIDGKLFDTAIFARSKEDDREFRFQIMREYDRPE